jgi:hypothetical protein
MNNGECLTKKMLSHAARLVRICAPKSLLPLGYKQFMPYLNQVETVGSHIHFLHTLMQLD